VSRDGRDPYDSRAPQRALFVAVTLARKVCASGAVLVLGPRRRLTRRAAAGAASTAAGHQTLFVKWGKGARAGPEGWALGGPRAARRGLWGRVASRRRGAVQTPRAPQMCASPRLDLIPLSPLPHRPRFTLGAPPGHGRLGRRHGAGAVSQPSLGSLLRRWALPAAALQDAAASRDRLLLFPLPTPFMAGGLSLRWRLQRCTHRRGSSRRDLAP
jgi:hypothetical protein